MPLMIQSTPISTSTAVPAEAVASASVMRILKPTLRNGDFIAESRKAQTETAFVSGRD